MIYIDTSAFLKALLPEPESEEVNRYLMEESEVIFSSLTCLETEVQLRAKFLAGRMRLAHYERSRLQFAKLVLESPFRQVSTSADIFNTAVQQHLTSRLHCRSLDRLHLAAMEELGIRRLMTHDFRQAEAAREMGIDVVMPGVR
jgi:predicted nucleic acid-binding protein